MKGWHQNPDTAEPPIGNLGGGSDHVPLYMHAGIPSASVGLYGSVPIYHTNYDTFWFYEDASGQHFSLWPGADCLLRHTEYEAGQCTDYTVRSGPVRKVICTIT